MAKRKRRRGTGANGHGRGNGHPRAGGILRPVGAGAGPLALGLPVGGTTLAQGADVSGALGTLAPTFGDMLASVGQGVASSQAALDRGVIDTVRALADTTITVVTEVIEELNDDGLPDVANTRPVTQTVSVLNYVTPTVHEWKHVALQMDMQVAALDSTTGIQLERYAGGTSTGSAGLLFGLIGVGYFASGESTRTLLSNAHLESQWAQGRVQMDAVLGPRRTGKFPVPVSVTIGPQIFISQGAVVEQQTNNIVTARSIAVQITVRKANGAVNPNASLIVDAAGLLPSFQTGGGFTGGTTNVQGRCLLTLTRQIPNPAFSRVSSRRITVQLGDIRKTFDVTI